MSEKYYRAGSLFLSAALLLISLPRSWSLYPLGFFLFTGLLIWINDFKRSWMSLKSNLFILLPPIIYFILHLTSVVIHSGPLTLLTDRLMFLLIPIFGLPFFVHFRSDDDIIFFKSFIYGIIFTSLFLIARIIYFVSRLVPEDMTFLEYALLHKYWFFSAHLTIFEHPTYFSMKIIWVLILLNILNEKLKINHNVIIIISIFLSIFLFFTASRAAIILWVVLVIYFIARTYMKNNKLLFILTLLIPVTIFLAVIAIENEGRVNDSVMELETKIGKDDFRWKDVDQRTREWYTAIQIIKKKPLTGVGLVNVKQKMKEEYYRNGFYEEARLNMNAHNQFLEAQLTFGIAGTISLILMFIPLLFRRKHLIFPELAAALAVIMLFFLMFESMFNRQWGIMFFLLFYFILSKKNLFSYLPKE